MWTLSPPIRWRRTSSWGRSWRRCRRAILTGSNFGSHWTDLHKVKKTKAMNSKWVLEGWGGVQQSRFWCHFLSSRLELQLRLHQPGHDQGPPSCSVPWGPGGPVWSTPHDTVRLSPQPGQSGTQNRKHLLLLSQTSPTSDLCPTDPHWYLLFLNNETETTVLINKLCCS